MNDDQAALEAARSTALHTSGWGRRFVFYQPRNLAFWVYLLLVSVGATAFVPMVTAQPAGFGGAVVRALVLFGLYGLLFWWFTQRVDRYATLPVTLLVAGLLWGAFAASWALAANANGALGNLYAKSFGQSWALDWSAGLSAPFSEELCKGAGLVLLIALAPRVIRTAFDGFVLGAVIGLGFQVLEDISYALTSASAHFGADPVASEMGTIWARMITGVAGHVAYSAIFCAGLVYAMGRPAEPRRLGRGVLLMATAMLLHGVWDSVGAIAGSQVWLTYLMMLLMVVVAVLVVVWVYRLTVARERELMRTVLAPEVARQVITPAELGVLAGDRTARRAFRKALGGRRERRAADYVLEAAHDLAEELASARGAETDRVRFARSEVERIRRGAPSIW
ncbi:PrsW family intramembrane metalloprotease [Mycolicibacterium sp. S2-37]|nr:PrsW family intramembrane metalloprotease [Mycolicibacterium sp. S2-37]